MRYWLGLGGNIGNRLTALRAAVEQLTTLGVIERCSSVWESAPVGGPPQPDYYNAAVVLRSELEPRALMERLLEIESVLGRRRSATQWDARIIDIDVLMAGERGEVCVNDAPTLIVPHPRLHERAFALSPLLELEMELQDPVRDVSLAEELREAKNVALKVADVRL